mmetsp:Transcript_8736/g.21427  ORF Transcript_8736/g.21427 Transcript_8736/m.21427 type:complete len:201 (+) Transcript_8736:217-819(+)
MHPCHTVDLRMKSLMSLNTLSFSAGSLMRLWKPSSYVLNAESARNSLMTSLLPSSDTTLSLVPHIISAGVSSCFRLGFLQSAWSFSISAIMLTKYAAVALPRDTSGSACHFWRADASDTISLGSNTGLMGILGSIALRVRRTARRMGGGFTCSWMEKAADRVMKPPFQISGCLMTARAATRPPIDLPNRNLGTPAYLGSS